jgi:hypothetical protein
MREVKAAAQWVYGAVSGTLCLLAFCALMCVFLQVLAIAYVLVMGPLTLAFAYVVVAIRGNSPLSTAETLLFSVVGFILFAGFCGFASWVTD